MNPFNFKIKYNFYNGWLRTQGGVLMAQNCAEEHVNCVLIYAY